MTKYFKIVNLKWGNHAWRYSFGIHDLKDRGEKFNKTPICGPGGLYFTTSEYILDYVRYGDTLCEITPLGKIVEIIDMSTIKKFKTDRLKITSMLPVSQLSTWKFMVSNKYLSEDNLRIWANEHYDFEMLEWINKKMLRS